VTAKATGARPLFQTIVLPRHRGLTVAVAVFIVLFLAVSAVSKGPLSYFDLQFLSSGSATLALAAMGETVVVLVGGFDLSVGAVISLVNVALATNMTPDIATEVSCSIAALALGAAVGAFNGFFIAVMRLQPIVVTLATMFIVQGLTLLILNKPGGAIPPALSAFLTGDVVPNVVPAAIVVLLGALAVWGGIKRSRLGTAIYAVGGDEEAATARGINVTRTKFLTYTLAGTYYGAAGLYISASSSGGDPLVGAPMLLQIFTAVVLGGTAFGGGRGGCVGTLFASFTLATIINALLILNVAAYYSTLVQGALLIAAGLAGSLQRHGTLATAVRRTLVHIRAIIDRSAPRYFGGTERTLPAGALALYAGIPRVRPCGRDIERSWAERNADTLRIVWPAWALSALVIGMTVAIYGSGLSMTSYVNSLMVLASFLAVLGLGQGAVVISGGLDLSIPWTVTFTGVLLTGITSANPSATPWAIPFVLAVGTLVGAVNGVGIVIVGLPAIVMTLAMNGVLQAVALVYSNGTPTGVAPTSLQWFMTGRLGGLAPSAWSLILFAVFATLLLSRTTFGRRLYAVGNSQEAARLSGVGVGRVLIGVYALSGLCSAIVGVMLAGFATMASLGMGDPFLLPSIAVVVVGGTLISGGQGHYLGIFGGALLLTAISTLFAGTTLPPATRDIILGIIVLFAIIALRERKS
jgi:ribose transport system permease protein